MSGTVVLTVLEAKVLDALRSKVESKMTTQDGRRLGSVYLDNAHPAELTDRQFAGVLGSLATKGYYWPQDDCFGDVLIEI